MRASGLASSAPSRCTQWHASQGIAGWSARSGANQMPWALRILRLHQVANRAVEVHAMAAKAIFHQAAFGVVHGIGKDLAVGGAVRPGMPGGVFVLVALLAVRHHLQHIHIAQPDGLRPVADEMNPDVAQLGCQARLVAIHAAHVAMRRTVHHAHVRGHLVAACAALPVLR